MSGKFFLDTNIFIYAIDGSSSTKAVIATALLREGALTRRGAISYQVVQEFLNVALRKLTPPMTEDEAQQFLATILRPMLMVQSSFALYGEALQIRHRYKLSWYDSLIVAAALEAQCEVLYSEDLQHGQKFGSLVVKDPFR
jgi:predicted nucleic acid-binding protein